MTATTTTTIQGVSVLSRQKKRGTDVFELGLSHEGIEVRRPGRPVQQMTWERVSEWEIEERKGYVLLTLRGRGATTPLIVPGWSLDELELLMRDVTSDAMTYEPEGPGPVVADANGKGPGNGAVPSAMAAATTAPARTAPKPETKPETKPKTRPKTKPEPKAATVTPAAAPAAPLPPATAAVVASAAPTRSKAAASTQKARPPSRAERRQQRSRGRLEVPWKAVVTVGLLVALGAAVALVLLQSAGVISWGFLGPIA